MIWFTRSKEHFLRSLEDLKFKLTVYMCKKVLDETEDTIVEKEGSG